MAPFGLAHPERVNVWTFFILYGTAIINNEHKLTAVWPQYVCVCVRIIGILIAEGQASQAL